MSKWDYILPHRMLINKSLRIASQELRERIAAFQAEYDKKVEACQADLVEAENKKNKEAEDFRIALENELKGDLALLSEIKTDIIHYTDIYFQISYLKQTLAIKESLNVIFSEDYSFLTNQITYANEEIDLLRERQNELIAFTSVDDILKLAEMCGYNTEFNPNDSAQTLLSKISEKLKTCQEISDAEKHALLRLRAIVQERSDYLPLINYISWVIQIKIHFVKQLKSKKAELIKQQKCNREDRINIKKEIHILSDELSQIAIKVRYHWEIPTTYINADISYYYSKLQIERERLKKEAPEIKSNLLDKKSKKRDAISEFNEKKDKLNNVYDDIQRMKDAHSSDQWTWENLQSDRVRLKSDKESLSDEISRLSSEISSLQEELNALEASVKKLEDLISAKKRERKEWAIRRQRIVDLIRKYDKSFQTGKEIAKRDEIRIIETRLEELQIIRENGEAEAQLLFSQQQEVLKSSHQKAIDSLNMQMRELKKTESKAKVNIQSCSQKLSSAAKKLEACQSADKRFVLIKMLFERPEETEAKAQHEKAKASLERAKMEHNSISSKITELQQKIDSENKNYEERKNQCRPRPLRPTEEESLEETKLLLRKKEIDLVV